jgi:hypothetical protein
MRHKIASLAVGLGLAMSLMLPAKSTHATTWWNTHRHYTYTQKIYQGSDSCHKYYVMRDFYELWLHEIRDGRWTGYEKYGSTTYTDSNYVENTCINV